MREDRRTTIRDLVLRVPEICPNSVHKMMTEKLGYNKVVAIYALKIQFNNVEKFSQFIIVKANAIRLNSDGDNFLESCSSIF